MNADLTYPGARLVPAGVRVLAVAAAAGGGLLTSSHGVFWGAIAAAVAALAAVRPDQVGSGPPLAVLVAGWAVGYGSHPAPLPRTVVFAILLLLLYESLAFAADVPLRATASARVLARRLRHLGPGIMAAVAVAGVVAVTSRVTGSAAADVVGVAGGCVVMIGLVTLLRGGRHR